MDKKCLSKILLGAGAVLVALSLILLCVSAAFVEDIERAVNIAGMSLPGFELDVELTGDIVRSAAEVFDDLPDELLGYDTDLPGMLRMLGVQGGGFKLFALNARGWCFGIGLLSIVAGIVTMALSVNERLGAMFVEFVREFAAAVEKGFGALLSGLNLDGKLRSFRRQRGTYCSDCGAKNAAGARFCCGCGRPLE